GRMCGELEVGREGDEGRDAHEGVHAPRDGEVWSPDGEGDTRPRGVRAGRGRDDGSCSRGDEGGIAVNAVNKGTTVKSIIAVIGIVALFVSCVSPADAAKAGNGGSSGNSGSSNGSNG